MPQQARIRLHDDVGNRVREVAQASRAPVALIANELLRHSLDGQNGKVVVEVHHIHVSQANPEFRAKLIKGQRGSYGFELTVADADRQTVLEQIERFEEEMTKRYGDEEEKRAVKVRKDIDDLYGTEPKAK
jgi:hypothetical protein